MTYLIKVTHGGRMSGEYGTYTTQEAAQEAAVYQFAPYVREGANVWVCRVTQYGDLEWLDLINGEGVEV